mgnify:CR=1 FL=1
MKEVMYKLKVIKTYANSEAVDNVAEYEYDTKQEMKQEMKWFRKNVPAGRSVYFNTQKVTTKYHEVKVVK